MPDCRQFRCQRTHALKRATIRIGRKRPINNALGFKPDVVIIMLGTNDTKPENWETRDRVRSGPAPSWSIPFDRLSTASPASTSAALPVPAPAKGNFGMNEAGIQQQIPRLDRPRRGSRAGVIDMHAALEANPEMLPDRVHPNAAGAGERRRPHSRM